MIDPHDPRQFGGVPIGNHVQPGSDRLMVQMQQPDGSMVLVPVELATLHVLAEIRTEVQRIADLLTTPGAATAEATSILGGNDGETHEG